MNDADRTPDELTRWLADICDMAALLPDALVTRTPAENTSRPAPSSRPPVPVPTVALMAPARPDDATWEAGMQHVDPDGAGVLPYLWGWVRDIEASMYDTSPVLPDEVPLDPTVANCAAWLVRHVDAAHTLPQWPELVYGVRVLHGTMRRATASVRDIETRPVPCARCGDSLQRIEGEMAMWECGNGHQVKVQAVTLRQASSIVRVPLRTLQAWAKRNLLVRLRESERVNLYDLGDIRRVAAEVRMRSDTSA